MIIIKQRVIITAILISIIGLIGVSTYLYINSTPKKKLEKIIEQHEEIESEFEELEIQDDTMLEDIEEEAEADPVRIYLSDKLNQAIEFFFTKELNIVGMGDSLTEGVGDPTGEGGYIGVLNRMINKDNEPLVKFSNFGKRGSRSDQLIARLDDPEVVSELKSADIILITIGANDIMQIFKENFTSLTITQFTTEEIKYESRLEDLLSKTRQINASANIYLLGFYNPFGQYFEEIEELELIVNSWNTIGESVAEQYRNVAFIPMKDLFEKETESLLSDDHFHPNYEGYRLMAERILNYMIEEGDDHNEEK